MNIKVTSKKNISQVCEDLQEAVTKRKFGVVGVHDMKETMAKKGVAFGPECRIYEVCHPGHAQKVLGENIEISSALPCRIAIYENEGQVVLSTLKPSMMLEMFGANDLASVAEEVEAVLVGSMEEAAL